MEHEFLEVLSMLSMHNPQSNTSHIDYTFTPPKLLWPGGSDEEICLRVLNKKNSHEYQERMTRPEYFYFSFCYQGNCRIRYRMSENNDIHTIQFKTQDVYAGQPYLASDLMSIEENSIIISLFIKENAFFSYFMPHIVKFPSLFHFFIGAANGGKGEKIITLSANTLLRNMIQQIVIKYMSEDPNKQDILKSMTLSFLLEFDYLYSLSKKEPEYLTKVDNILRYMIYHLDSVTITDIANHFGYHPNYVSTFLRQSTGKTFSIIIIEQRMIRAKFLLEETNLTIEEISRMIGYYNTSNFYKKFKKHFGSSPRVYLRKKLT